MPLTQHELRCRVFAKAVEQQGGCVKVMRVPDGQRISNARLKPPKGDVIGAQSGGFAAASCLQSPCSALQRAHLVCSLQPQMSFKALATSLVQRDVVPLQQCCAWYWGLHAYGSISAGADVV